MGKRRDVDRVLIRRSEGKRPLERPKHRWEDNINMDLREIGIDGANSIPLAQNTVRWLAFVNTVMNLSKEQLFKEYPAPWSGLVGWLVGWLAS
jgi:hypothetical protein